MRALIIEAWRDVKRPRLFIQACAIGVLLCLLFPTDLHSYRGPATEAGWLARNTDSYLRFVDTAAQVALPVVLADKIGAVQLLYVAISTTLVTHGLKRLFDRLDLWGTRLGQRPASQTSHHNMPSGHSSMASCAAYFVGRRYGWWQLLYLLPIMLLTMYARVELNQHTIAAVCAGALLGLLTAAIFTSHRRSPPPPAAPRAAAASSSSGRPRRILAMAMNRWRSLP